ncbi:hypothetical protein GGX14DRAFT_554122 [Mycena pura]|uniref:Uncharacterized protein n=1 Tax=Mycena pura TaxID=153505 RepID=A0AAD6YWK1_9AGAR|nr:hypothetical protein GGX14DRAFT_554122 [Mycena pura]
MFSASHSTTSLVSNTTVSSRTPLAVQPKDFQSAFASLQSTYGFGQTAPSPLAKSKGKRNTNVRSGAAPGASTATATTASQSATHKDFGAAFADLQSTYGFCGSVPSPVSKRTKHKDRSV